MVGLVTSSKRRRRDGRSALEFIMRSLPVRGARIGRDLAVLGLAVGLLSTGCQCVDRPCSRFDEPRLHGESSVVLLGPGQEKLKSASLRTAWSYRHFGERIDAAPEVVTDGDGRVASSVIHRLADADAWLLPAAGEAGPRFAPVRLRDALAPSTQHIQLSAVGEFTGLVRGGPRGDRRVKFRPYGRLVRADGRLYEDEQIVVVGSDDTFRGPTVADRRVPVVATLYQVFDGPASEPLYLGGISGPIAPGCEVVIQLDGPVIDHATISARRPSGAPVVLDVLWIRHSREMRLYSRDGSECSGATFRTHDPVPESGKAADRIVVRNVSLHRPYVLSGFASGDMKLVGMDGTEFRKRSDSFDIVVEFQGSELEVIVPEATR